MKELILVLYLCSGIANTCMPPYQWPERFDDSFTCMVKGYEEAASKTKEIGPEEVNQYKIYIKFDCILVDPIVPLPKPEAPPKSELTT